MEHFQEKPALAQAAVAPGFPSENATMQTEHPYAVFLRSRTSFTLLNVMPGLCWPV
jgi:hypothetical protein